MSSCLFYINRKQNYIYIYIIIIVYTIMVYTIIYNYNIYIYIYIYIHIMLCKVMDWHFSYCSSSILLVLVK